MHHQNHLLLHKRQQKRRRSASEEHEIAQLEELALMMDKRQQGHGFKDAWNDFTDGVKEAWDQINSAASKNEDNEKPTTTAKAQTTTTAQRQETLVTETSTSTQKENNTTKTDGLIRATVVRPTSTSESSKSEQTSTATEQDSSKVGLPASIAAPTETSAMVATNSPLTVAHDTPTLAQQSSATATATSAASTEDTSDNAGSKAGIAFGIIGGLLVISLIVFFIFKRRRQQMDKRRLMDEDEKVNASYAVPANGLSRNAPRLSLGPSSAFDANFSRQPTLPTFNGVPVVYPKNTGSTWERPRTGNSANNPANPFGNHAERVEGPGNLSPVPEGNASVDNTVSPVDAIGHSSLSRKQSVRKDGPMPLDLTLPPPPGLGADGVPPSPAGTEYSSGEISPGATVAATSGTAAIAAAGGPANSAVHRVQLDFKPTMEDEMELKAGGLVRLLFEYDDGWALCIRLDRSQQGVVPRTCLSTRPVKPRPSAPSGQRPGPPISTYRPHNPPVAMKTQGYRAPSPPNSQSRSPSPQHWPASQQRDAAVQLRKQPSIERKPVPGQAL